MRLKNKDTFRCGDSYHIVFCKSSQKKMSCKLHEFCQALSKRETSKRSSLTVECDYLGGVYCHCLLCLCNTGVKVTYRVQT